MLIDIADGPSELELMRVQNGMGAFGDLGTAADSLYDEASTGYVPPNQNVWIAPAARLKTAGIDTSTPAPDTGGMNFSFGAAAANQADPPLYDEAGGHPAPPDPSVVAANQAAVNRFTSAGIGPREAAARANVAMAMPILNSAAALLQKGPQYKTGGVGAAGGRRGGAGGMSNMQTYLLVGGGLLVVGMLAFALSSGKKKPVS
jgi:hypothetical protein